MGKSKVQNFLKGFDRYAKGVSLSYRRKGSFETSIGGICSILSFTMLTYWLGINLIEAFLPPGEYSTSTKQALQSIDENGMYKQIDVPQDKLFSAYKVTADDSIPEEDISKYVQGVWLHIDSQKITPYTPIKCLDAPDLQEKTQTTEFQQQLQDYMCADMRGDEVALQNTVNGDWYKGQSFHFIIDTCAYLVEQDWSDSDDCIEKDKAKAVLDKFVVQTKIGSQFFSAVTYEENDEHLSSSFMTITQPLSGQTVQHKSVSVFPQDIKFQSLWLYADSLLTSYRTNEIYTPTFVDSWSYPETSSESIAKPKGSFISFSFHQSNTQGTITSKRTTLYEVLRSFGSLLSFTIRFTVMAISQMQGFSLANSLIKKLYSAEEVRNGDDSDDGDGGDSSQGPNRQSALLQQKVEKAAEQIRENDEKEKVKKEIEKRETFSYKYERFWYLLRFDRDCCYCCRPKKKREDFLYKSAKSKLSEEIDILEIVKKLRVHQFACQQILQPHQRDLVNFFQDYKIEQPGERRAPSAAEAIQGDNAPGNVEQLIESIEADGELEDASDKAVSSLYKSIAQLDPYDRIDAKVIARVTNQIPVQRAPDGRPDILSAQDVRQDMKILKKIRASRNISSSNRSNLRVTSEGVDDDGAYDPGPAPRGHFPRKSVNQSIDSESQSRLLDQ